MAEAKLGKSLDDIIKESSRGPARGRNQGNVVTGPKGNRNKQQRQGPRAPLVVGQNGGQNQSQPFRKTGPVQVSAGRPKKKQKRTQQGQQQQPLAPIQVNARGAGGRGRGGFKGAQVRAPLRAHGPGNLGVARNGIEKRRGPGRGQQMRTQSSQNWAAVAPAPLYAMQMPQGIPMPTFSPFPPPMEGNWQPDRSFQYIHPAPAPRPALPQQQFLPGTRLMIKNLDSNVTEDDIKELFSVIGAVQRHRLFYNKSGLSMGEAEVTYSNKEDAVKALQRYNLVALDGKKMVIELVADSSASYLQSGIRVDPSLSENRLPAVRGMASAVPAFARTGQPHVHGYRGDMMQE